MARTPAVLLVALAALALAPSSAAADELHGDVAFGAAVPLAGERYTDAVEFGGQLAVRGYLGHLAAQLELAGFAQAGAAVERLTYRGRVMAGARWRRALDSQRGMVVRALGGVELGGFDRVGHGGRGAEAHHLGFAAGGAIESHSELYWADVSIGVALNLTVQPFGEDEGADYVGVEGVVQLGFGY